MGLWGSDFEINNKEKNTNLISKIENPKKVKKKTVSKKTSISEQIRDVEAEVKRVLGVYEKDTVVIKTKEELDDYIETSIDNGIIAIDTETNNSLDPLTCKIMGACLYTPNKKNAYVPINHINPYTNERLDWQLTESDLYDSFIKLDNNCKIITHNGKFDLEVLYCTCGWKMSIYWDTMLGSKMINENGSVGNNRAGLKQLYIDLIDPSIEKYDIEHLFKKLPYAIFEPSIFALYSATDSYMTYKLYEYQKSIFELPQNAKLFSVFKDVEMEVLPVVADMELVGIELDTDYSHRIQKKYHAKLDALDKEIEAELKKYDSTINAWRHTKEANEHPIVNGKEKKSKSEQLSDPVSLTSPTQLAILLYDIIKVKSPSKKNPRGTGSDILESIDLPLCKLLIERKKLDKLIGSFLDSLPNMISEKDGRIHTNFNQLGAGTGRFSSSNPNLQQIPSHNYEIRMMFKASDGNVLVGADYSQQEPRLLTYYTQDENLLNAYNNGKDIYATMGMGVYNNNYWDNMEHYEDGTLNLEGKKRRSAMKVLFLGISYGMGNNLIAQNLGCSTKEAKSILDNFYEGFPKVSKWKSDTEEFAHKNGYVEDIWGRRRRLPDIQLEPYIVRDKNAKKLFNPLLVDMKPIKSNVSVSDKEQKYLNQLKGAKYLKEINDIKDRAKFDGVSIIDNSGYISSAERQCVNACIQGGAATMSKKAMIKIGNDSKLKELGFKLLICIHDEVIGECPKENSEEVSERLSYLMRTCVPELNVPFKCDAEIEEHWYENNYVQMLKDELAEHNDLDRLCAEHSECTKIQIEEFLNK